MRALTLILITCLAGLWTYFGAVVAKADSAPPVPIPAAAADAGEPTAEALNNRGVLLDRAGRQADGLAFLERAHQFRPNDKVILANLERQSARVQKRGWLRALVAGTLAGGVFIFGGGFWRVLRGWSEGHKLAHLHVRGDNRFEIRPGDGEVELPLRFNQPVAPLLRRHPLTVVWSSRRYGKHMKSRPPVTADGSRLTIRLDRDRVERLARYPGAWRGFLYLGRTQVGEAAARVG